MYSVFNFYLTLYRKALVVASLLLCLFIVSGCTSEDEIKISPPDFIVKFEREAFGSKNFGASSKAMLPVFEHLREEYEDISVFGSFGISIDIGPEQIEALFTSHLGDKWQKVETLPPEIIGHPRTYDSWTTLFRNGNSIFAYSVLKRSKMFHNNISFLPIYVITNADFTSPRALPLDEAIKLDKSL